MKKLSDKEKIKELKPLIEDTFKKLHAFEASFNKNEGLLYKNRRNKESKYNVFDEINLSNSTSNIIKAIDILKD